MCTARQPGLRYIFNNKSVDAAKVVKKVLNPNGLKGIGNGKSRRLDILATYPETGLSGYSKYAPEIRYGRFHINYANDKKRARIHFDKYDVLNDPLKHIFME